MRCSVVVLVWMLGTGLAGAAAESAGPSGRDRAASLQAAAARHWAFRGPERRAEPEVKEIRWPRNSIDRFILAALEARKITPSPEADRVTLIRRLSLDLLGLPPTPEEVDAFVHDARPDAYDRLVERLLTSPHYGERAARHWLDVARYADSNGYSIDAPRSIWRYRDWVIDAFNRDLPFDRFVVEQLAGDMLPGASLEQRIATGFHRNTPINEEGGIDKEQFRIESVIDRVNTTATAFLGLTFGCAQCHDHKFDPFTQQDYFRFYAFMNNADEPALEVAAPGGEPGRRDPPASRRRNSRGDTTMVLQERATPRESYVFIKGDFTRKGEIVTPGVPQVLPQLPSIANPNRLDLARWIVDPGNPLTARVTMNRAWQRFFGKGLVETENDFGTQGAPPTHPELLDWLATEFIRQGWSLKAMDRLIVRSASYRQASRIRPELDVVDPLNKLLARQSRLRLEAEIIRDMALTASGQLTDQIGGPSVYPPQPDGVMTLGQSRREWTASMGAGRFRRGLYTFFWRATPHPGLMVFDAPDATSACTRRIRSNTPLQALTLLNDQGYWELAEGLAARVLKLRAIDDTERINLAFRLCVARSPSGEEARRLKDLLELELAAPDLAAAQAKDPTVTPGVAEADSRQFAAWTSVARVLLNLDETITRE